MSRTTDPNAAAQVFKLGIERDLALYRPVPNLVFVGSYYKLDCRTKKAQNVGHGSSRS